MPRFLALVPLLAACSPPDAPEQLDDLSRYLFQVWDDEDPRTRSAGLANLHAFLAKAELAPDQPLGERSWTLALLEEEDVATIVRPERPLDQCIGVSLGFASRWPVGDHARMQAQVDQLPAEPSAETYVRGFQDPSQPTCFPPLGCEVMETVNDARRSNIFIAADFILFKDFRWVTYEDPSGEERRGFYSRSWFEESWPGDGERGWLWQSYAVDVWLDAGDGEAWRYQALWSETELALAGVTDDVVRGTVTGATDAAMNAGDDAIGALFHGEGDQ